MKSYLQLEKLKNIPEVRAAIGNQAKMSKQLLYKVIDRAFLTMFTWTGKSSAKQTKLALKDSPNIIQLLHGIVSDIDNSYSYATFLSHLKNKILKYAYE